MTLTLLIPKIEIGVFMIQLTQQGNVHILTIDAPEGNAFDEKYT
jgi:hypothetical protein